MEETSAEKGKLSIKRRALEDIVLALFFSVASGGMIGLAVIKHSAVLIFFAIACGALYVWCLYDACARLLGKEQGTLVKLVFGKKKKK